MRVSGHKAPKAEAFRDFVEGVASLQAYLRSNDEKKLTDSGTYLTESLTLDPEFAPAQYYKAIVLTHAREQNAAIGLLEDLRSKGEPYETEILYNLAFAYARTYEYDHFKKALELLDGAAARAKEQKRTDLILLVNAMRAWALAAFAGRHYGHPEDFENRKRDLLPKATEVAESVLRDSRLSSLQADTRTAVEVEAHNAAGIAYMRMGHFADLFSGTAEDFWRAADDHYRSALAIHPRDVRVLDNVSTLNLIRGSSRLIASKDEAARACFTVAIDAAQQAISNNSHDRFRHYNLSQALALSDEWHAASQEAGRIMKEPGAVKQEQVDNLKKAILAKDKTAIVNIYYPPKKS